MFSRNKLAMVVAEFLGTGILTLVIVSVQRSTIGIPYFVGLAAGLAAGLLMLVFNRASGAFLNPALTLGMWTARRIRTIPAIAYIAAELLGGYLAGLLYRYYVGGTMAPLNHDFSSRVLVAEAVGTAVFAMAAAAAVFNNFLEAKKAALFGGGLAIGIIAASSAAAGILNPAVALGANAWTWSTYVLGPVLGGLIGVNLYGLVFAPATVSARVAASGAASASTAAAANSTTDRKATAKKPAARKTTTKRRTTKRSK
jgi:glycerol uptake facilitator protein